MAHSRKQNKTFNGFAIPLQPDTDLGLAMLIAESEDGSCRPIAVTSTISEAKELAESDLRERMRKVERGQDARYPPSPLQALGSRSGWRVPRRDGHRKLRHSGISPGWRLYAHVGFLPASDHPVGISIQRFAERRSVNH
jgi:hypothetical protein